jgi:hypothetical protein
MKLSHPFSIACFHLLFITTLLVLSSHAAIGDWGNYYFGATGYHDGNAHEIYDVARFNNYVDAWRLNEPTFLSYTQVPPLSLLIYFPFTLMKVGVAKLVFTALTYLFCAFSITRLFKKMQLELRWSLLLPLLLFLPLRSNIDAGQSYFLLIALLAEGWIARENGKWILAGILFALAIHLKIFPAIVLIWLLAEKDWKTFGATLGAVLIFFGVSLAYIDYGIWKQYCVEILPRLAKGEITNTYATAYQSMPVLLKQIFVPNAMHNPAAIVDSPFIYKPLTLLWTGIVLAIAFLFSFDKKQNAFLRFSIWIFAGMLISGYGSTYGLLLLIFPAIALLESKDLKRHKKFILLFLIALVANVPMAWIMNFTFPFSFLRLFLLICLFAGILIDFRPQWNRLAYIGLFIPLLSLANSNSNEVESDYFLDKEPSLLITDFNVKGDTVIYTYRDVNGLHEGRKLFPAKIESAEEKGYNPDFAFWEGVEYRFEGEQISKLVVINKKYFLFLSDKNRGVGFYSLRIKKIDPNALKKQIREIY